MATSIVCPRPDRRASIESAAEIGDQIERRRRRPVGLAKAVQRAGEGEIIDVVPHLLRHRPLLPPTRHSRVNKTRIDRGADLGTKSEPLHHTRTKAFDQRVRVRHEIDDGGDRLRLLEVERDRALVAIVEVELGRQVGLDPRPGDAIDTQDLSAEIAEQGSRERRGADSAHLDDAKAI